MTARSEDEIRADLAVFFRWTDKPDPKWRYEGDAARRLANDASDLLDSRERAIRWAVTLEGQNAAMEALLTAIREQANLWRTNVLPGTHGNALECCGDAIIDMFDDFPLVAALTGSTEDAATDQCKNGHPFEPGVDIDMVREGRSPSPLWCNVCGESR